MGNVRADAFEDRTETTDVDENVVKRVRGRSERQKQRSLRSDQAEYHEGGKRGQSVGEV